VSSKRKAFKQIQPSATSLARVAARGFSPKHTGRGAQLRQIEATIPTLPPILTADFKLPAKLRLLGASTNPETFVAEKTGVSEIAVVGRSNVGKSTLLNALTEAAPARADDRPGVTRAVHVYNLLPKLRLVDLPGYGFAFGKPESKVRWTDILLTYLTTRKRLGRVLVLLDARHGLKEIDRGFLAFLEEHLACRYQIVLTKCDLVPLDDLARRLDLTCKELAEQWPRALPEVRIVRRALPSWL
jgi:ribosome biogenesis GTP-binding protein YsxC/EngB